MATMAPPGGGRGGTQSTSVQSDDLPNSGFIAELSPALTAELIEGAPSVYYPEGSIIFSNGSGTTAALVVSGLLRYYMAGADGRELTVRYVGPGDMVGTLISERSSLSTRAQAIRPSVLLHLDVDRVQALALRRPELSQAFINELSSRLRFAFRALAASAFMPVRARVARDLVERAKMLGPVEAGVRVAVTQQSLADATGSVREVVARALRELRREGAIATYMNQFVGALTGLAGTPTLAMSQRVIESSSPLLIPGVPFDEFISILSPAGQDYFVRHPPPVAMPAVGLLVVPMRVGGATIGTLGRFDWRQQPPLTEADVDPVQLVADHVALLLENARLHAAVKDQAERLAVVEGVAFASRVGQDLRLTLRVVVEQITARLRVDAADVLLATEQGV